MRSSWRWTQRVLRGIRDGTSFLPIAEKGAGNPDVRAMEKERNRGHRIEKKKVKTGNHTGS